jgi:hypothetical protein
VDLCCEYPFPGFTINNEAEEVDALVLGENGIVGLDGAPIRRQVQPRGEASGGLVHGAFYAARVVQWSGKVLIQSVDWALTPEFLTAINTLQNTVKSGLASILNADYTLNWTETGQSPSSLVLRYGMPGGEIQFSGTMLDMIWRFTTVSSDPGIG